MRVTVTGATGRIGTRLVGALRERGDEVTVLSRDPDKARASLGVETHAWQPESEPAPVAALAGRDGVVHLAGEDVAQRWSDDAKRRLMSSRELGTRNLVAGLRAAERLGEPLVGRRRRSCGVHRARPAVAVERRDVDADQVVDVDPGHVLAPACHRAADA